MLAFGIGATTAIFSIVEGVLLRPLPFENPARLVALGDELLGANFSANGGVVTAPDVLAYKRDTQTFEDLGGYTSATYELSGKGEPAQINATRMTAGVFSTLRVPPALGRTFTSQEDAQSVQVTVLSYATWRSRFHQDPRILGEKVLLDRKPYLVIGVMPETFDFPLEPGHLTRSELWVPMSFTQAELTTGASNWNFSMVGRLKPGVTTAQAQSDAERVALETMRNYPAFMSSLHIKSVVRPLQEATVEQARPLVRALFLAVAVVLLIACANLAGLLLVRAIRRQRQVALRMALGASGATLLRQVLLESLILSVSGGLLGVWLADVALRTGKGLLPETLPRVSEIGLNWTVMGFALLLALGTGVLCGLAPAVAALRTSVNETLKEGGRNGSSGGGHTRLRSTLVVAEIAVALILLTASGLLLRSFDNMRSVNLGYRPEHITTADYSLPQRQYATQSAVDSFNKELLSRLTRLPGADSAALTSFLPASGEDNNGGFVVEGYVPQKGEGIHLATNSKVRGDYFGTMGIPLMRGRPFTDHDQADAPLVVIVNQKLAEHYWPHQDPIGKRARRGVPNTQTPWLTVVGEIGDVKLGSPDEATKEQFYLPVDQAEVALGQFADPTDLNGQSGYVVLRSALPPEQMENALRATVRSMDPLLPLTHVETMERVLSDSEASRRFNAALIGSFAIAAVLLAVLGIYSVVAFSVASRVQEMAIRMALGSQRTGIMRLILISGAKLAAVGCALGLVGASAASRLLRSLLFGVSPFDPIVLTLAAVAVLLLALAASILPARRAALIDPMQALRGD